MNPVMLPPGCERLATNPVPTGLPTGANMIGIVEVRRCAAAVAVEPPVTRNRRTALQELADSLRVVRLICDPSYINCYVTIFN